MSAWPESRGYKALVLHVKDEVHENLSGPNQSTPSATGRVGKEYLTCGRQHGIALRHAELLAQVLCPSPKNLCGYVSQD